MLGPAMREPLLPGFSTVVIVVVLAVSTGGCGGPPSASDNAIPANTPGATPDDAASVNCPANGGPSSGTLTGLGATIGQFRQAHPQDPQYSSQFGATITGGANAGLPELTARCSTGGVIVSVHQNLSGVMSDAQVKASLVSLGIAPADAALQSVKTLSTCEIFFYQSASIGSDPGANDTAGTFLVELEPPATVSSWDPSNVASLIYDLDESGGC